MQIINQTPDTCEQNHIFLIYYELSKYFSDDFVLMVRRHNQPVIMPKDKKGIIIILSAEGHTYIPPEIHHPNTLGVFMNYAPFHKIEKLFPLQLGTTSWFTGDHYKPINDRKYDFSFIGQYDPYARNDFYSCLSKKPDDLYSFVHFYEGWNKGLGPEVYSNVMSDTKIALVPCGSASLDTFRFYEAMYCGCVVITKKQNEYEFMTGAPFLSIPAWEPNLLFKYIKKLSETDLSELSAKTRKFWEDKLSPQAAARFIMNKLGVNYANS